MDELKSEAIINRVMEGKIEDKPGWIRISLHPTTTNTELAFVCDSIISLSENSETWKEDYVFKEGKYLHKTKESHQIPI